MDTPPPPDHALLGVGAPEGLEALAGELDLVLPRQEHQDVPRRRLVSVYLRPPVGPPTEKSIGLPKGFFELFFLWG